jgi:protein-S-isoprenylcysteine O-methyltransferase Ste14
MDPINIIIGLNIIATFGANVTGAKKGLKSKVTAVRERSTSYLQKLPLILSTVTLAVTIISLFQVGTLSYLPEYQSIRIAGLIVYLIFSWIQIWSYKSLGDYYSQDIVIFKDHKVIANGPFNVIRHPQYLSQILVDLAASAATLSFILLPLAIIQIPFLILRAKEEERLLEKYLGSDFISYKKSRGFIIPFIL